MRNLWLTIIQPKASVAKWLIFLLILCLVSLSASGQLVAIREILDAENFTFAVGSYRISVYQILNALLVVVLVFWIAAIISDLSTRQISRISSIDASNRTLVVKITQIFIYVVALFIGLDFIGVDLTTLTIFGGALGIGLGFGLNKITSNFVSGLILLFEKSIKEGDLLELSDGTYGFIRKSSARFTLIETFDGKEILVPNEDLITSRVVNWTYSDPKGRIEIRIGVSYGSDLEKAFELLLEAATEHPRCSTEPEPNCYLANYGDSSVDFILHFFVDNVTEGRWGPKSDVLFSIWHKFKAHGIEIPFPQRDLHIKEGAALSETNH